MAKTKAPKKTNETAKKITTADGDINIRCSELPRVMACPASLTEPTDNISIESEVANIGTAAHEGYATMLRTNKPLDKASIKKLAITYQVPEGELSMLIYKGWQWWQENMSGATVETEVEMSATFKDDGKRTVNLTGHADAIVKKDNRTIVIDWKTGFNEVSYTAQLLGYALLASQNEGAVFTVMTVFTRLGTYYTETFERGRLKEWQAELLATVRNETPQYTVGKCCTYCPSNRTCKARAEIAIEAVNHVGQLVDENGGKITIKEIGRLKPYIDQAQELIDGFNAAFREVVKARGSIKIDDDHTAYIREEIRLSTKLDKALLDRVGDDAFMKLAERKTVSKSDLCAIVGKDEFQAMADDGFMTGKTIEVLSVKKS